MNGEPDFLQNLRQELAGGRRWLDRCVVIGFAVLAGLAVVGFTLLAEAAFVWFQQVRSAAWWAPLVWTPACTAALVWATRRWCPQAAGSGVPQVMSALAADLPEHERDRFVSLKSSAAKVLGVSGGLLAGLSVGRQGPSVQIAAGVMRHARRYLSPRSSITERELLVAGGAAGIAAAFNTPLGGIVFAIEELIGRVEQRSSGLMLAAIVVSGLVAVSAFGNLSYFGRVHTGAMSWALVLPGLLVALVCGLLGGLLARLMLASLIGQPDRWCAWRARFPVRFAAGCGFAVALIGVVSDGAVLGGGHHHTRELLEHPELAQHTPVLFTWLKFVASWLSSWAGVPGGIFAPALSMGAAVGADIAWLVGSPHGPALIALGMAAFLAAVTQTPITAMIIVMEMIEGHGMVLSLMAAAFLAAGASRMVSLPLYSTMSQIMLRGLVAPPAAATQPMPRTPGA